MKPLTCQLVNISNEESKNTKGLSLGFYNDLVYLENTNYKALFGKEFKSYQRKSRRRGIVKICYKHPELGKICIRRLFVSGNAYKISKKEIGLSMNGIHDLCLDNDHDISVLISISRGNRLLFIWNHPNHLVRIGFIYTMLLGGLAVIISILGFLFQ